MLAPSPEFLESKTPHRVSDEASAKPSEGKVFPTKPSGMSQPLSRYAGEEPDSEERSRPMCRTVRLGPQG